MQLEKFISDSLISLINSSVLETEQMTLPYKLNRYEIYVLPIARENKPQMTDNFGV